MNHTQLSAAASVKGAATHLMMQLHVPRLESCNTPVANAVSVKSTSCTNLRLLKAASDGCVVNGFVSKSQRQDIKVQSTLASFNWETL